MSWVLEGRGGEGLFFFSKLRTLQNAFKNNLSVIEVLCDHLTFFFQLLF
jgi:hypothetical protein